MSASPATIHLPDDLQARLDRLAKATGRASDLLITEALWRYVEHEEWQIGELRGTLTKLAAGQMPLISAEELLARHLGEGKITQETLDEARAGYGAS